MTASVDYEDLIDRVYETAVDPNLWPDLLKRLAGMMGGSGAAVRWCDAYSGMGTGWNYAACNPHRTPPEVMRRRLSNWVPRVAVGEAWMPRDRYVKTEYYNDFGTKFALDWDLSIGLDAEGDNVGFVNVFRSKREGSHCDDNLKLAAAAQPHLIRALKLGRRLAVADVFGAEVIERTPNSVFLLNQDGRVRHLNAAAERLIAGDNGLVVVGGRLTASGAGDARRLEAMIGRAVTRDPDRRTGGSMAVTTPNRRLPLSLIVAPVRSERAAPFFFGPSAVVCVTDMEAGPNLPEDRLRDLFGLSVAESRVAMALFEGLSLREASDALKVSYFTIRGHVARIFDKTGVNRQADLVRLMLRAVGGDLPWV